MDAKDVRRWAESRRAAEARDLRSPSAADDPQTCWRQALSLFVLLGRMVGWPVAPDAIRRREDAEVATAWEKLRAASRRHG